MLTNIVYFIGIGAPKCASSWLWNILNNHQKIYMPHDMKEINFFNDEVKYFGPRFCNFSKGISWYTKLFSQADTDQIKGETSNVYLYSKNAAERIYQNVPHVKIIVTLRNPIDMIHSQFYYMNNSIVCNLGVPRFEDILKNKHFLDFLELGCFYRHLSYYFDIFPEKNIHVILLDDIIKNPKRVVKNLYTFLNIDNQYFPSVADRKVNKARKVRSNALLKLSKIVWDAMFNIGVDKFAIKIAENNVVTKLYHKINTVRVKNPPLTQEARLFLQNYYKEDIDNLMLLLHRDLTHWK